MFPDADDVNVARALASSLLGLYSDGILEIRFFPRGTIWYDVDALAGVDVLIVLAYSFDLGRALAAAGEGRSKERGLGARWKDVKPSLIAVAWMREWAVPRWCSP